MLINRGNFISHGFFSKTFIVRTFETSLVSIVDELFYLSFFRAFLYETIKSKKDGDHMGSTLESSIYFSLILILLSAFIIYPNEIRKDTCIQAKSAVSEMRFRLRGEKAIETRDIDGHMVSDTSPEQINTMICGFIDCIKIGGGV